MALSTGQRRVVSDFRRAIRDFGATPREQKALFEAGIVESHLQALTGGDRDSTGALQQRPSQGWGPVGESAYTDATQFLRHARVLTHQGFRGSAGSLAQAVQRSAFPGRYDQQAGVASQLAHRTGGTAAPAPGPAPSGGRSPGSVTTTTTTPGESSPGDIAGLVSLLSGSQQQGPAFQMQGIQPPDFAAQPPSAGPQLGGGYTPPTQGPSTQETLQGLSDLLGSSSAATSQSATFVPSVKGGGGANHGTVGTDANPSTFRQRHSPLFELFWQGPGGIDVKNGQVEPQGFVSGHRDHVHVAAGPKTVRQLGSLAQSMGLHVGENPSFGGVHPVHVKGSYHYSGRAVDVSGDPGAERRFAHLVAKLYGLRG